MSLNIKKIFIFFILINICETYIVLFIKGNNPYELYNNSEKINFTKDFLISSIYNNFYTVMGIGKPEQNVVIRINPIQKDFLFTENNCKLFYNDKYINKSKLSPNNVTIRLNISRIGYIKNISKSFIKNDEIKLDSNYNKNFFSGKERLILDDYRNILTKNEFKEDEKLYPHSQSNLIKFGFVYEETDSFNEICGSIGLASYNDKNNNKFVEQLKTSNITQNYYWSIKYISLDIGYILFGDLPYQYLNNKGNKTYNFIEIYNNFELGNNKWSIKFVELFFYLNNNKEKEKIFINSGVYASFNFTMQLIVGSLNYKNLIFEHFFREYFDKNICILETYSKNISYSIIKCDKNQFKNSLNKFPNLYLNNKELQENFILSYEDLFISFDDRIYFLVIFRASKLNNEKENEVWELGIPFLKKYQMTFNSDTKKIGYYINLRCDSNNDSSIKNIKSNNNFNFSLRTFLEIIMGFMFLFLLIYLLKKLYFNKTKQRRPYELQDEYYDYFSNTNNKDKIYINKSNANLQKYSQIIEMENH